MSSPHRVVLRSRLLMAVLVSLASWALAGCGDETVYGAPPGGDAGVDVFQHDGGADASEWECLDDTTTSMQCPDGTEVPNCTCVAGRWQCEADPSQQCLTPCDDGSILSCRMATPTCQGDEILAIIDGCYLCVRPDTCQVADPSPCSDGSTLDCEMSPPDCTDFESLALIAGCWECVDPATCRPWGEPGCQGDISCPMDTYCDPCVSSSCPECEDCVADCVPHQCNTGEVISCPEAQPECGPQTVAVGRDGCWECVDATTCQPVGELSECERRGGTCTDFQDTCPPGSMGTESMGCPLGRSGMCCLPRTTECDDGSDDLCDMMPPVCTRTEVLAIQDSCWVCVNPVSCAPWGEPGCETEDDCSGTDFCDPCATASCPGCRDCIAACVAHG